MTETVKNADIPGPIDVTQYELVHGDKEDTTSKEARLDELFQSFRKRLENLTSKPAIDESIDKLLCDAKQIYPDYPNTNT